MESTITIETLKTLKHDLERAIADTLVSEPMTSQVEIARRFGCSREWVIIIAKKYGIARPRGRKPSKSVGVK